MIPGYDFYAEEEDPSPYRWVMEAPNGRTWIAFAGPFADHADAAKQLRARRIELSGYTVKLLKDGQVWEPTA